MWRSFLNYSLIKKNKIYICKLLRKSFELIYCLPKTDIGLVRNKMLKLEG